MLNRLEYDEPYNIKQWEPDNSSDINNSRLDILMGYPDITEIIPGHGAPFKVNRIKKISKLKNKKNIEFKIKSKKQS
ncbi:MAG: hypothetical protein K0B02_02785 [DPANN group archaeon]|nr:hypothetical protein [DPANN group archaeon]